MVIAGRDEGVTNEKTVTIGGFFDADFAERVEALGELAGEFFGHVLHNGDCGEIGRQRFEEIAQGLSTAGGSANGDDFVRAFNLGKMGR
jgi:hypothetical protein